jgi:hypothetical protein
VADDLIPSAPSHHSNRRMQRWNRPRHEERGTALMLLPAFVLIGLMLAAVVVDGMAMMTQHRQLADAAQAAANDAASAGVRAASFDGDAPTIDLAAAQRAAARALSGRRDPLVSAASYDVSVEPAVSPELPAVVQVTVTARTHGVLFRFYETDLVVSATAATGVLTP